MCKENKRNWGKDTKELTLPGTRSFHQFIPISDSIIDAKYVSDDQYYVVQFDSCIVHLLGPGNTLSPSQFVACLYDRRYWVGIIVEVLTENLDVKVKFMHHKLPTPSLKEEGEEEIYFLKQQCYNWLKICIYNKVWLNTMKQ